MHVNKDRLLLFVIRGLGVAAAAVLLVAKCPYVRVMDALCVHDDGYGSTYRETKLRPFKIPLPARVGAPVVKTDPETTANYRLFVVGDSYIPENHGHEPFVRLLADRLREPAFFASFALPGPACLFRDEAPRPRAGRGRVVLLERAERYLPEFAQPVPCPPLVAPRKGASLLAVKLFDQIFMDSEERLRYLLLNSRLTAPLVGAWNTELYLRFGLLPSLAPAASREPPDLFSRVEVAPELSTSFNFPHDEALISSIAGSLERTADQLRSDDGAELVFMPIPNKYTLYHRLARTDERYDDFLPRLYKELERRNIRYIDLYHPYMASPESVYMPNDPHWNGLGVSIALDEAARAVRPVLTIRRPTLH